MRPTTSRWSSSTNSAGKLGATIAATRRSDASSARTSSTSRAGSFAPWLHTRTQLPQPMHRGCTISAWRSEIRIALAGHSRTHV